MLQVVLDLFDAHLISRVDDIDESISLFEIVAPVGANFTLTTDIPNVQLKTVLLLKIKEKRDVSHELGVVSWQS